MLLWLAMVLALWQISRANKFKNMYTLILENSFFAFWLILGQFFMISLAFALMITIFIGLYHLLI